MNILTLKQNILNGILNDQFELLYGETNNSTDRYTKACDSFCELFGENRDVSLFSAPGRTEVGGNHTDHQHGCVFAGSVNLDVIGFASKNDENVIRIKSEGFPMDTIDLNDLSVVDREIGTAASLIRGMASIFKENGYNIGGFDAYTTSNVLKGSGLSSSAAFEVLIGIILDNLYNSGNISAVDIAKFSQKAENVYFGKPCGLMDQMASSVGGFISIDFKDVTKPAIKKCEFNLKEHGYSLCIVNTGGNHADLTQDYADITIGDKKVANYFSKDYLSEVSEDEFYNNLKSLREEVGDRAVLCALHYFDDTKRAKLEAEALLNNDVNAFLKLINESGNSSFKYLQNVYSIHSPNEQGLSVALALTEKFLSGSGACRVHGGGFAGTIQAFVPNDRLNDYKTMIEAVFGTDSCYVLNIRSVGGYSFKI